MVGRVWTAVSARPALPRAGVALGDMTLRQAVVKLERVITLSQGSGSHGTVIHVSTMAMHEHFLRILVSHSTVSVGVVSSTALVQLVQLMAIRDLWCDVYRISCQCQPLTVAAWYHDRRRVAALEVHFS